MPGCSKSNWSLKGAAAGKGGAECICCPMKIQVSTAESENEWAVAFDAIATAHVEVSQQILEGSITNAGDGQCLMVYEAWGLWAWEAERLTSAIHVKVEDPLRAVGHSDLGHCADVAAKQHGLPCALWTDFPGLEKIALKRSDVACSSQALQAFSWAMWVLLRGHCVFPSF